MNHASPASSIHGRFGLLLVFLSGLLLLKWQLVLAAEAGAANTPPVGAANPATSPLVLVTIPIPTPPGTIPIPTPSPIPPAFCRVPGRAIPDNNSVGVSDTVVLPAGSSLEDLNLSVDATHTWVGDLIVTLHHAETNTSVTLIDRPGHPASPTGCGRDNLDASLDDEAVQAVEAQCAMNPPAAIFGNFIPHTPLAAFDGQDLAGTWTLTVSDNHPGDTGTFKEWCLAATTAEPTPTITPTPVALTLCQAPGVPIPDLDPNGVVDSMPVPLGGLVKDLDVSVDASHTWVGDLIFTLRHDETDTAVTFIDRPGRTTAGAGCGQDDIDATLDDEAHHPVEHQCAIAPSEAILGTFAPNNPLSAFDGEYLTGTWHLTVADMEGADTGLLKEWCLNVLVVGDAIPTATLGPGATATPTATATVTPTATQSGRPSPTPSATPTNLIKWTATATATPWGTQTPTTPTPTLATTTTPVGTTCAPPPPEMTAWFPLDETSGPLAADIAGIPTNGTWQNGPLPDAGMVDGALHFDGANDFIEVPDHPSLNFGPGNFSIDAWVWSDHGSGGHMKILDKRVAQGSGVLGYSFYLEGGTHLALQMSDGNWFNHVSPAAVNDGRWHFVAVTVDRSRTDGGTFYVDGQVVGTFDPTNRPGSLDNPSPLTIGVRSASMGGGGAWFGLIDEVELFPRVLSPAEILAIFQAGSGGKCKPSTPTPTATPWGTPPPVTPTPIATLRATATSTVNPLPTFTPLACLLPEDQNGDLHINIFDLQLIASQWGQPSAQANADKHRDPQRETPIDIQAIMRVAAAWGMACPATADQL